MELIAKYIDPDLLLIIVGSAIAFLILKLIFKFVSGFRILKIIFTVLVLGSIIFMSVKYIEKNEEVFSKQTNYFVYGKIDFMSKTLKEIKLDSIRSSYPASGKGEILIKLNNLTSYTDKTNINNKQIGLNDIDNGDIVLIYCEEKKINPEAKELTAVKVIKKYNANSFY